MVAGQMLLQGSPNGRLLAYHPASGETQVVADDVWWANGVALSASEEFVAVVETAGFRVYRQWLKGPKVGASMRLHMRLPAARSPCTANAVLLRACFWLPLTSCTIVFAAPEQIMRAVLTSKPLDV